MIYSLSIKNNITTLVIKLGRAEAILLRLKNKVNTMCLKLNSLSRSILRFFDRDKYDLATAKIIIVGCNKSHLILHMFVVSTYADLVY